MKAIMYYRSENGLEALVKRGCAAMVRICGKELIFYQLDSLVLADSRISDVIIVTEYCGEVFGLFKKGEYNGVKVSVCTPSDFGGLFEESKESCLLCDGSVYCPDGVKKVFEKYNSSSKKSVVLEKFCADENKNCPCGIYLLNEETFENIHTISDENGVISKELVDCKLAAKCVIDSFCCRVDSVSAFLEVQSFVLRTYGKSIENHSIKIHGKAEIVQPVYIGANVFIGNGAHIKYGSVIDDNAVVGEDAVVSGSYVGCGCTVSKGARLFNAAAGEYSCICEGGELNESSVAGMNSKVCEYAVLKDKSILSAGCCVKSGTVVVGVNNQKSFENPYIDEDGVCGFSGGAVTAEEYLLFGCAVGSVLETGSAVAVGCSDLNGASEMCRALEIGLSSVGINVFDVGKCVLPNMFYASSVMKCPLVYCGTDTKYRVQLCDCGGLPCEEAFLKKVERNLRNHSFRKVPYNSYGKTESFFGAVSGYKRYLARFLPDKLKNLCVRVRTTSMELSELSDDLFHGRNNVDGELVTVTFSDNGRKFSLYNEAVGNVTWERLVNLVNKIRLSEGKKVSVPFAFPSAAEAVEREYGGKVLRYSGLPDGEKESEARACASDVSGLYVRDAMLCLCEICGYLDENRLTLAKALSDVPDVYFVRRYMLFGGSAEEMFEAVGAGKEKNSGEAVFRKDESRAVIRPLRHGDGILVFAEAKKAENACELCGELEKRIRKYKALSDER